MVLEGRAAAKGCIDASFTGGKHRFDIVGLLQWATNRHRSVAYVTVRLSGSGSETQDTERAQALRICHVVVEQKAKTFLN